MPGLAGALDPQPGARPRPRVGFRARREDYQGPRRVVTSLDPPAVMATTAVLGTGATGWRWNL